MELVCCLYIGEKVQELLQITLLEKFIHHVHNLIIKQETAVIIINFWGLQHFETTFIQNMKFLEENLKLLIFERGDLVSFWRVVVVKDIANIVHHAFHLTNHLKIFRFYWDKTKLLNCFGLWNDRKLVVFFIPFLITPFQNGKNGRDLINHSCSSLRRWIFVVDFD